MLILLFLLASTVIPVIGDTMGPEFSFSLEKPIGFAWYDLEAYGTDPGQTAGSAKPMIRSELNFPLDPFRLALGIASTRPAGEGGTDGYLTELRLWSAVSPAFFRMRDEDWYGASTTSTVNSSRTLIKFSDTRSRVQTWQMGGELIREGWDIRLLGSPIALGMGMGGSFYYFEVFGLDGKQLGSDGNGGWVDMDLSDSKRVGTYMNFRTHASMGIRLRNPILGLHWNARLHPLGYSHSLDDHILRKKTIRMDCWGTGGALEASRMINGGSRSRLSPLAPFLRFEMDKAWGKMTQTYYADSPDGPEDETGRTEKGIRTSVNHWLVSVGFRWGMGL